MAAELSEEKVTPADIKAKLSEIDGSFQATTKKAAPVAMAVGAAAILGIAVLAYSLGRRRGRKRQTVVEIRRI
ncbi:MAG TPA: hypothetical protein VGI06_16015 [Acidimicrobiales bacterium]